MAELPTFRRTTRGRLRLLSLTIAGMLFIAPTPAVAQLFDLVDDVEWFVGGSVGRGSTRGADLIGEYSLKEVDFSSSTIEPGVYAGGWLGAAPAVGFTLDTHRFATDIEPQRVDVCASDTCDGVRLTAGADQRHLVVSLRPMLRLGLKTSRSYPRGRLQPFVGVGPSLAFSSWAEPGLGKGTTRSAGFSGVVGVDVLLNPSLGLQAKYRLSRVEPEYDVAYGGVTSTVSNRLTRSHLAIGLTYVVHRAR